MLQYNHMINTVSITDLKQNTAFIIKSAKTSGQPVVVLQRSEVAAVLLDPDYYKILEQSLEDLEDLRDIELRKNEPTIPMDKVMKKIFAKK